MKRLFALFLSVILAASVLSAGMTASADAVNTAQTAYTIQLNETQSFTFKKGYPTHTYNSYISENEVYYAFTPSTTAYYEFNVTGYDSTKYIAGKTPDIYMTIIDGSNGKTIASTSTNETTLITRKAAKLSKGITYYIDLYSFSVSNLSEYSSQQYGYAEETINLSVTKHTHSYEVDVHKYSDHIYAYYNCRYCDYYYSGSFYKPKTVTLSADKYTYNGSVKKPTVTVKDSNGKKIDSSNYTVTYPSGRKDVGKYKIKVTFQKAYESFAPLYKTFTIVPKSTTLSKVTGSSKAFTATWKKQTTQVTGYQIQYAKKSNFSGAKTVTVSGKTKTSKKVTGLAARQTYYVRVRTYKTVSGTKIYSSWSAKKSVKTK